MLITLAIIGVVAAMTIPTLIQNYKKKVVETRLLRFYSTMNQAINLSEIDNGPKSGWDRIEINQTLDDDGNVIEVDSNNYEFFNKYISPYIKTLKVEEVKNNSDSVVAYFSDGSLVTMSAWSWNYLPDAKDLNDFLAENDKIQSGRDFFTFFFNPKEEYGGDNMYHYNRGLEPYARLWFGDIDDLKTNSYRGCNENATNPWVFCTKWIQMNNWKIPEDYPFKF